MKVAVSHKGKLARSQDPFPIDLVKTEGDHLIDSDGRKYIDFTMGWCVGNLGWGNNRLRSVIKNYSGPDYVYPNLKYKAWDDLAELLGSILPGDLEVCFRTTGGSESVETALEIAMAYTGRKKICSLEDSYHGNTLGSISIGATESREPFPNLLSSCMKIELPLDEKALQKVETRLKNKDVAAFIMEPVILNNGVHIPAKEFMTGVQKLCKKFGTLLIIDEVPCGFFRTGKFFGFEHFIIQPDIVCLGKGITGGYVGLGATVTTPSIAKKVKDKVSVYSTYGWHPLSTAVALENISIMKEDEENLTRQIQKSSQQFRTSLSQMGFKKGGKLSIIGLAIAVDVEDKKYAEKIFSSCLKDGLFLSKQETKLVMFPSLTISEDTIKNAMEILKRNI